MAIQNAQSALVLAITAFALMTPAGPVQAQGKSGAHLTAQDVKIPVTRNLSARGSIAMVPGSVPLTRNLSARGSLAPVNRAPNQQNKEGLNSEAAMAGL